MSEIQEMDVYIKPDGTVVVEVRGVKGRKCLDLTAALEELLGGQVLDREHTYEYDEQTQETDEHIEQRGY